MVLHQHRVGDIALTVNKQAEDRILEMVFQPHEKSQQAHPLDPQKGGMSYGGLPVVQSIQLSTHISSMGIDAICAQQCQLIMAR